MKKMRFFCFVFFLVFVLTGCQNTLSSKDYATNETEQPALSNDDAINGTRGSAVTPYPYQGKVTADLMPWDWTFLKSDVPIMISELQASDFSAVYVDHEVYVRVTNDEKLQMSDDAGVTWMELDSEEVSSEEFAEWLWQNDPLPGYSMKEMQTRLREGATVRHIVLEEQKEIFFVMDEKGTQLELVQPKKMESVLIDGQRLMLTSTDIPPDSFSNDMINAFETLLKDTGILEREESAQEWNDVVEHLKNNGAVFYESNAA